MRKTKKRVCMRIITIAILIGLTQPIYSQERSIDESIDSLKKVLERQELTDDEKAQRSQSRKLIREIRALDKKWEALQPLIAFPKSYKENKDKGMEAYRNKDFSVAIEALTAAQAKHNSFYSTALDLEKNFNFLRPKIEELTRLSEENYVSPATIPALEEWQYIENKLKWGVYGTITQDELKALPEKINTSKNTLLKLASIHYQLDEIVSLKNSEEQTNAYLSAKRLVIGFQEIDQKVQNNYAPFLNPNTP